MRDNVCVNEIKGCSGPIETLGQLSADGRMIISGAFDKTVKIWDAEEDTCEAELCGHSWSVGVMSVSKRIVYIS